MISNTNKNKPYRYAARGLPFMVRHFEFIRKTMNYLSTYWIFVLFGSAFYVYVETGAFPQFSKPDPNQAIPNYQFVRILYHSVIFVILIAAVLNLLHLLLVLKFQIRYLSTSFIVFSINLIYLVINIFVDPFGLNSWFMD